jgi:hypothetical protein
VNITGWVWSENFRPYLRFLASLTEAALSAEELGAVIASLEGSDAEFGVWREYVLRGMPPIGMALAVEVGFDCVQIQFDCDERIGPRAEAAMEIMMRYSLTERPATPAVETG